MKTDAHHKLCQHDNGMMHSMNSPKDLGPYLETTATRYWYVVGKTIFSDLVNFPLDDCHSRLWNVCCVTSGPFAYKSSTDVNSQTVSIRQLNGETRIYQRFNLPSVPCLNFLINISIFMRKLRQLTKYHSSQASKLRLASLHFVSGLH